MKRTKDQYATRRGERHANATLSNAAVRAIKKYRHLPKHHRPVVLLAEIYGCSPGTVSEILAGNRRARV